MREPKEKTVQKTYRLPTGDAQMIELLAANQILGSNKSAVVRTLITAGLKELVESEFVRKHKETMALLSTDAPAKGKKKPAD